MTDKVLDCVICGRMVSINEMYSVDACSKECQSLITKLAQLRDNYKASQELRQIREGQIEELLNEKAQLRAALDKAGKVIDGYITAGMHTHGDFAFEEDWEICPRCIARKNLSAWLEELETT